MSTWFDHARALAARGSLVFPLHVPSGGGCSCGNSACPPERWGKHPRTPNGFKDATSDPAILKAWAVRWPEANIAIATGSGLLVLDVDPRHGGSRSLAAFIDKYGTEWSETVEASSGGGGRHLYFSYDPSARVSCNAGKLGAGLDVRGDGGYIVAPPSKHSSGSRYAWREGASPWERPTSPAPPWLLEALDSAITEPSRTQNERIEEGARNSSLFRLACSLRRSGAESEELLEHLNLANETRCDPPLPASEVSRIAASAAKLVPSPTQRGELRGRVKLASLLHHPQTPWVVPNILPAGAAGLLYGEPEAGKTWIYLSFVAEAAAAGNRVVVLDEQNKPEDVLDRLLALGLTEDALELVQYHSYPGLVWSDAGAVTEAVLANGSVLVVFDALAECLAMAGANENDATDVSKWVRGFAAKLAHESGAAVLIIDHLPKGTKGKAPRGSGAKLAGVDFAWLAKKKEPFGPGQVGSVELQRTKDRSGSLPQAHTLILGDSGGSFICQPVPKQDAEDTRKRVLSYVSSHPDGVTRTEVCEALSLRRSHVLACLSTLVEGGLIRREGTNRSTRYVPAPEPEV